MIDLYTPAQVRQMDADAVAAGVSVATLMERAAGALAREIIRSAGWAYGLRVGLLCGKGNNGGDGIAAARRLRMAGAAPVVCLVDGAEGLNDLGQRQLQRYLATGGRVAPTVEAALGAAHVGVDCLLGTGASGEPRDPLAAAIRALNAARGDGMLVLAADLPSGVDADTGTVAQCAVRADVTVTFGAHKRGLWLSPARAHAGRIVLGEIGVPIGGAPAAKVLEAADVAALVPALDEAAEKRTRGQVLIVAGSDGMSGAAVLCARGAMAAGAGLVQVATTAVARAVVATQVPEALTLALPSDPDDAAKAVLDAAEAADAVAIGPGMGHDDAAGRLVRRLVGQLDKPLVLDADGLNVFRNQGDRLADHAAPVLALTPHRRELDRLLGTEQRSAWDDRISVLPERAARWGAALVAKGPGSIVAGSDGRVWINPTGSPALATGGSGDVLTGMTTALLGARPREETVAAAVWLHGLAGELAGARVGERSVTASDVAVHLGQALGHVR